MRFEFSFQNTFGANPLDDVLVQVVVEHGEPRVTRIWGFNDDGERVPRKKLPQWLRLSLIHKMALGAAGSEDQVGRRACEVEYEKDSLFDDYCEAA